MGFDFEQAIYIMPLGAFTSHIVFVHFGRLCMPCNHSCENFIFDKVALLHVSAIKKNCFNPSKHYVVEQSIYIRYAAVVRNK
jgi:hypothetical protein